MLKTTEKKHMES